MVQLETFGQYAIQLSKKHEDLVDLLEAATYVVDHGNIGGKRSRMTFPHDFQGAKQYFDYAKGTYDWTELLMSVNIHYNEEYVNYKRIRMGVTETCPRDPLVEISTCWSVKIGRFFRQIG